MLLWSLVLTVFVHAQSLSEAQQKSINNYIELTNQMTGELYELGPALARHYGQMLEYRNKPRPVSPYTCRFSSKEYYVGEARKTSSSLGSGGAAFIAKSEAAYKSFQKIDEACKAIEIYYRLKDYESDNFTKFEELVNSIASSTVEYRNIVQELQQETDKLSRKLQPYLAGNAYHKTDKLMRDQLAFERTLVDALSFNLNERVHTGWPVESTQKHILEVDKRLPALQQGGTGIQYPASSMYTSFVAGVQSLQEVKRNGVDGYTFEKQQSDEHSNNVYRNMLNYYNNDALSFYNQFVKMASQNGYRGVFYLRAVPVAGIRSTVKDVKIEVNHFKDKTVAEFKVAPVATPVTAPVFSSLSNYIELINEGVRQVNHMMNPMHNLNSSASHGKARMKTGAKVKLEYSHKSFELPVTLYQKTIEQTKVLPAAYQKPLADQAEVLYSILTELNQLNNLLQAESASGELTKDSMEHVYTIIERFRTLAAVFDDKKERLYTDARKIFSSYKVPDPASSWLVSGNALLGLLDEDHAQLANAKSAWVAGSDAAMNTAEIERLARDLITNEYTNLAGIQKIGRSNGLCPYSPYEDLATYSRQFAESFTKTRQGSYSSYYRHPYNALVSSYNQSLLGNYNKFCELAKVPLLKSVAQVETFEVVPPKASEQPSVPSVPETKAGEVAAVAEVVTVAPESSSKQKKGKRNQPDKDASAQVASTAHDTVRIETLKKDTVYISRVDTVYVNVNDGHLRSMEGYATNNMVLLLDVSGSMNSPEKLPLLKKSVLMLMEMMRTEDQVSIITFSGKPKVELPPTSFKDEQKITSVIAALKPAGKTDANSGIKLAYQVADKNYIRGGNNRIILATDGEFPIGNPTYDLVKKFASEDIFITVFNFGKTTISTKNLQQLAELGRGNYEYITRENVDLRLIMEAKAKRRK